MCFNFYAKLISIIVFYFQKQFQSVLQLGMARNNDAKSFSIPNTLQKFENQLYDLLMCSNPLIKGICF